MVASFLAPTLADRWSGLGADAASDPAGQGQFPQDSRMVSPGSTSVPSPATVAQTPSQRSTAIAVDGPATAIANDSALEALVRTIRHQRGDFAIILAHCNDPCLRRYEIDKLHTKAAAEIMEVALPIAARTLFSALQAKLTGRDRQPAALVVTGLEQVSQLDDLLVATNRVLNAFSQNFHFPIILWVDDQVLTRLARLAPDLRNRAPACIRFLS